ncbi:MAG: flagellar biosynthetic protein FliR [Pirellulales bacterium]|nr:flagellar biosynthetic protein FliR [Pirellulales bacterium]
MPEFLQSVLELFDPAKLLLFGMLLARTSGLVMIGPMYGSRDVPMRLRALFAVALTILILPIQLSVNAPVPNTLLDFLTYAGTEIAVGYVLSLGIWIMFSALQIAGQIIGQSSGMALANVFNPQLGDSIPLAAQFLYLFGLAIWLLAGGHRIAMEGFLATFSAVPPGSMLDFAIIQETLSALVSHSLELGIRIAGPVVAALLLSTLVMGLISRTLPQLNIIAVGFSLNSMAALAMISLTLGVVGYVFQDDIEPVVIDIVQSVSAAVLPATGAAGSA